ncbi:MAG: flavin monoamine oxidase family protein [Aquabacterium sp.]
MSTDLSARVAIIGGGLSGLLAAWRLQAQGVREVVVLEARSRLGGRVHTLEGMDLGATWCWPEMQPDLQALLDELGLRTFAQPDQGDMVWERSSTQPPMRVPGISSAPPSMRLHGGMGRLVDALHERLEPGTVRLGCTVQQVARSEHGLRLDIEVDDGHGQLRSQACVAQYVLLALPPRLAAQCIEWQPALPPELHRAWQACDTWMAPHAKYLAVYEQPFWCDQGLSGSARSALGPMVELHDASMPGGAAALFGFIGVPAATRQRVSAQALQDLARAQLVRLFGPQAATPRHEHLMDWAQEPLTATADDVRAGGAHPEPGLPTMAVTGPWAGCLTGVGSEWSVSFPGYLAGAVEAAEMGVAHYFKCATLA